MVDSLQCKRQSQGSSRSLNGLSLDQLLQQRPQRRCADGVAGNHLTRENREGPATTSPLAAVTTEDPLAPQPLTGAVGRIVAKQLAVPIQGLGSSAAGTAELLERKCRSEISLRSCTKRNSRLDICSCCPKPVVESSRIPTALGAARLASLGPKQREGRHGRHFGRSESVSLLESTRTLRPENGTFYGATAALNNQPILHHGAPVPDLWQPDLSGALHL